jgi:hypothetical protein
MMAMKSRHAAALALLLCTAMIRGLGKSPPSTLVTRPLFFQT